jgi:hypothetical protein
MSSRVAKLSPTVALMAAARGRRKARWYSLATLPWRALLWSESDCPQWRLPFRYNFINLVQADLENVIGAL